jgi:energy-coupling factor transporter ATP-binding protein EcfA2
MLVINLFGAPGAGKSTLALLVAGLLKSQHPDLTVECPDEIAKLVVYDESPKVLRCQLYIAGRQFWQIARCEGHADVVVCDSPVLLSPVYGTEHGQSLPPAFFDVCAHYHAEFPSLNYFVMRAHQFETRARVHDQSDERRLENKISEALVRAKAPFRTTTSSFAEAQRIVATAAHEARILKAKPTE